MKSCFNCKNLRIGTESWEMPWVWWHECRVRPANENLRHWPFRRTKCKHHIEAKEGSPSVIPLPQVER